VNHFSDNSEKSGSTVVKAIKARGSETGLVDVNFFAAPDIKNIIEAATPQF
jgi:hypothetical protein